MLAEALQEELTEEQSGIIEAVLTAKTAEQAAAALGMSRAGLYRRLEQPELREALRRLRGQLLTQALSKLHEEAIAAVDTLSEIMRDRQATAAARVRAAEAILDFTLRGSEYLDITEELAELRRLYEQIQQAKG